MSLGDVAAGLPWPVFPCNGDKEPIVATGFKAATHERAQVLALFDQPGAVMIGVPMGEATGMIAIDVDVKNGARGREWLTENEHALPSTRTHKTQSGGLHLIFLMPAGVTIRNSAGRVAPGVDVRGEGGYIIMPPSPGYVVADPTEPAEMPIWLVKACLPKPVAPSPLLPSSASIFGKHERYTQSAINNEIGAVMRAREGTRNDRFNIAAFSIGTLVGAGQLSRAEAEAALQPAGIAAGLTAREVAGTMKSGLDAGIAKPREMPERKYTNGHANGHDHAEQAARDERDEPGQGGTDLPLVWYSDIDVCLDTKDFVQGVLVEQGSAVVYGESNAGKTFWTTDLSLHVAAGATWNGRRVEQGGVVYCVLEGGNGFNNRVAAWRDKTGHKGIPFAAVPASINLLNPEADTQKLIETIRHVAGQIGMPVKLVVIDTLSRAMAGGNENAPDDMGALVSNMDRIRHETGACVLFVHHSGKDAAKGARGHSLLRAAIDTEVEVFAAEESDEKSATIVKQRELKKGDVFGFKLDVVELGENRHGEVVSTCIVVGREAGQNGTKRDKRPQKLSPGGALGHRAMTIAMSKSGAFLPPLPEYPGNTIAVAQSEWRQEFYQLKGGSADANKHAFSRAETELLARNVITGRNGLVWFIQQREKV
jgi:hypothetical protein